MVLIFSVYFTGGIKYNCFVAFNKLKRISMEPEMFHLRQIITNACTKENSQLQGGTTIMRKAKKLLAVILAISMIAVLFVAMPASAATLTDHRNWLL
jgi:hypothetical protein